MHVTEPNSHDEKRARLKDETQREDLRKLLARAEFRRLVTTLFFRWGIFPSGAFEGSARIHWITGRQSCAADLKRMLEDADPNAFVRLLAERDQDG